MSPGPHNLQGSCHCGQIKFSAKGVGFDDIHKCNCDWCIKVGLFHVDIGPDSIILSGEHPVTLDWDQPSPPGYEDKLQFYLSNGEKSTTRWYSCAKCHIFVFTTYQDPEPGEKGCTVSLRCLDLKPSGISLKDLTRSEGIRYDDLSKEVEENRRGEPFDGGEW